MVTLRLDEIPTLWREIQVQWEQNLKDSGVKLPQLDLARPSNRVLVLCVLYKYIGTAVSKVDLTAVVRSFNPGANDVQDGRHLGPQQGFNVSSGRRGDSGGLKAGQYRLENLTEVYPEFDRKRRDFAAVDGWGEIKELFGFRCATCGSKDGERHLLNTSVTKTVLHAGHMDPRKPLTNENLIPQCELCNQAYQDKFIFDRNGRVKDINIDSRWWSGKYRKA
jgi:hypothetical protein